MTKFAHETAFIQNIMQAAMDSFDGTPYALTKAQKAKAHKVLVVKKPAGNGPNCSKANHKTIIINLSYWQISNVEAGVVKGYKPTAAQTKDGYVWWREYKSFDNNPRCGGMFVKTDDVDHGNLIQVLHELAHYIQCTLYWKDRSRWAFMGKSHGEGFIRLYSILRDKFCNDDAVREEFIFGCNTMALVSQLDAA